MIQTVTIRIDSAWVKNPNPRRPLIRQWTLRTTPDPRAGKVGM